jgi:O-antigen ligase/tetratricopeptide (TPR) repeat protein
MSAKEMSRASGAAGESRQHQLLGNVLTGAFAALLVATPLLPSDTYSLAMDGRIAAPAMLWLVLAICATTVGLLKGLRSPHATLPLSLVDILFGLFFVWITITGVIASSGANRRAGWNMAATWATLGITYYLGRILLREARVMRATIAGIAVIGLMFSIEGWYERFVTIPQNQEKFRNNPQAMLVEAGVDAQPGTTVYEQFRSRLATQGPAATFALENSYAGFLAPVLPLGLGLWLTTGRRKGASEPAQRGLAGSVMIVALICIVAGAIFFAHSNAAMLATAIAICIGGIATFWAHESFIGRVFRYGSIAALAGIFAWPAAAGFVNSAALERLPLTLKYRTEYWRSCAALLGDYPLWGCAPGNFQDVYSRYKLPQASETIADPHNLVWEILCNSGLPALVLLACGFATLLSAPIRQFLGNEGSTDEQVRDRSPTNAAVLPLAVGAVVGIPLALLLSLSSGADYLRFFLPPFLLLGIVPAAALSWGLRHWINGGEAPLGAIWLAWLTVAIHFTVSGGISNPGTGTLFFLLPALGLNATWRKDYRISNRAVVVGAGLAALCVAAFAHYRWGYVPVLASQVALNRADSALMIENRSEAKAALREAADADPWSSTALPKLALLELQTFVDEAKETQAEPAKLIQVAKEAIERSPNSPSLRFDMAMALLRAHMAAPKGDLLREIKTQLTRATELAPTRAVALAYLAYVEVLLGEMEQAKKSAREALRLDSLNPHEQYDLALEPSPIPGRSFPGWLEELAAMRFK